MLTRDFLANTRGLVWVGRRHALEPIRRCTGDLVMTGEIDVHALRQQTQLYFKDSLDPENTAPPDIQQHA